ncbi:MAG: PAS domain S-box protein [Anaerolineae bacterium]|nr:PAS domain S-box protein [Anaerolineae bacterium]
MNENLTTLDLNDEIKSLQAELESTQVALRNSEKRLSIFFQEALDVILIVDGDSGEILDANRTVTPVLGYQRNELIGRPFASLFPLGEEEIEEFQLQGIAIGGQEFLRADGSTCPMDLTVRVIPWKEEDIAILVTLRDVTERKEAELNQKRLIRELDAFAHTVAHDLKEPLTGVIGTASFLGDLDDSMLSPEKRQEMLRLIMQSGQKMKNIIEELLLLAQMRNIEVDIHPLDMGRVVKEAQKRLIHVIRERQAKIIIPAVWPEAVGYAPWIEEVWVNYLSNALKYGGEQPFIEVGADYPKNGMVRFWMSDNGPGLTPEEQQKVFTEFTQLHKIRARGQGLGLSIVQRIVEKFGGEVGVESEVGQGSTFSFTLPVPDEG